VVKLVPCFTHCCLKRLSMGAYSFRKPCLDCGTLSPATRCDSCAAVHARRVEANRDPAKRAFYKGSHKTRSKAVREGASRCWVCGGGPVVGDPWQADHIDPTDPLSPLLAAHRSCNIKRALARRSQGGKDKL
jgi:hypothetical protein